MSFVRPDSISSDSDSSVPKLALKAADGVILHQLGRQQSGLQLRQRNGPGDTRTASASTSNGPLQLKSRESLQSLQQNRTTAGQRLQRRLQSSSTSPAKDPTPQPVEMPKVEAAAPVEVKAKAALPASLLADLGLESPALQSAAPRVAIAPNLDRPEEEQTKPVVGNSSSTGPTNRPSSRSLLLRKKQDSAVEGRRDVALERIANPVCCNCRVSFTVDDDLLPLSKIICPRCDTRQVVPARIDHFVLERELGRGGMGVTYRAFDHSLQRNVAVKLISEQRAGERENIEAMVQEARRAATLSHPNIVPIYSIGSVEGMPYVVMELLSDSSLLRPVAKGVQLGEVFVLETGLAIARALAEASANGILHLDVKPANILHDRFGVAKLIDFGLACHMSETLTSHWGTCLYMAPERLRRLGQDARSDQYSLGLTMWHALAGVAPFEAPDLKQLVNKIVRESPPILNRIRTDLLEWSAGLIHKMIAYRAEDRYQDYDQLVRAFEMVLNALRERGTTSPNAP